MFENTKREYKKLTEAKNEYGRILEEVRELEVECGIQEKGWNEYIIAHAEKEKQKIKIKFYENNYLYTLLQESKPILQKVFDKYTGKRIGEKTKDKIQDEFKEYGLNVHWYFEYSTIFKFNVYYIEDNYLSYVLSLYEDIYDENRKLKQLDFGNMDCYKVKEYVENIEERMEELERLKEEIKQKEKELNEIIKSHSNLCVSGLKTYDNVYLRETTK